MEIKKNITFILILVLTMLRCSLQAQENKMPGKDSLDYEVWRSKSLQDINSQISGGGHDSINTAQLKNIRNFLINQMGPDGARPKIFSLLQKISVKDTVQYMIEKFHSGEQVFYDAFFKTTEDSLYKYSFTKGQLSLINVKPKRFSLRYRNPVKSCDTGSGDDFFIVTFLEKNKMLVNGYYFSCDKDYAYLYQLLD